ncbi:tRNA-specific adenosine deaminase [Buchnera aphidicola (Tetraneura ulmi)]|uniref:tRNA adenosine(34) deaminase TadA n=1 Tax=Buchnera aphidicola TaxID=9 RepID=UPI003463D4FE
MIKNNIKVHKHWMKYAINLAKHSQRIGEVPIGSVLILNNKIIGEGFNSSILCNDPTAHAEIITLRKAARKIKNYRILNSILYVTLEPCLMCFGAILHSRVKTLVYGAKNNRRNEKENKFLYFLSKFYNLGLISGILEFECSNLIKSFFLVKRKKK